MFEAKFYLSCYQLKTEPKLVPRRLKELDQQQRTADRQWSALEPRTLQSLNRTKLITGRDILFFLHLRPSVTCLLTNLCFVATSQPFTNTTMPNNNRQTKVCRVQQLVQNPLSIGFVPRSKEQASLCKQQASESKQVATKQPRSLVQATSQSHSNKQSRFARLLAFVARSARRSPPVLPQLPPNLILVTPLLFPFRHPPNRRILIPFLIRITLRRFEDIDDFEVF